MTIDAVIVSEKHFLQSYRRPDARDEGYAFLCERELLPLRARTLTTEAGKSLVHLATWVYWNGCVDERNLPRITERNEIKVHGLIMPGLEGLHCEFTYKDGELKPASHSGALGRLVHAMGVPRRSHNLDDCEYERLPRYLDVMDRLSRIERDRMLYYFAEVMFREKLRKTKSGGYDRYFLALRHHPTKQCAQEYGQSVVHLLNRLQVGVFFEDKQVQTPIVRERYKCELRLRVKQVQTLSEGTRPLVQVIKRLT